MAGTKGGPLSLPPEQYTVGWICAIPTELKAARAMLDTVHARAKSQPKQDTNSYTLGSIGEHNIVIACLPEYGVVTAAIAANSMQHTFPNIRFGLMVGIGGGIPSEKNDIRLGDVVVSRPNERGAGVIQYDLVRIESDRFHRVGTLNKPPTLLRTAITDLIATSGVGENISNIVNGAFGEDNNDDSEEIWTYPMATLDDPTGPKDTLFKADFDHNMENHTCDECVKDCFNIVPRKGRKTTNPRIFYGNIASGNAVMKNGIERDTLAKRDNVICFEMEAAGLMDNFPCLVIRGICDYADSHKNKAWQPYAAAVAAAYAKCLLSVVSPEAVTEMDPIRKNQHWMVPRQINPNFTGRREILDILRKKLCDDGQPTEAAEQRRFVIHGIGGSGKSEVCLKFVNENKENFWGIFWIDASDEDSIRRGISDAAKKACNEKEIGYEDAKLWFENQNKSWLLIFDNADNASVDYFKFFPSANGNILMTTRNVHCQQYNTVGYQDDGFERLGDENSVELLLKSAGIPRGQWEQNLGYARKMVNDDVLTQHALAITQAGAFIRQGLCKLSEYPAMFEKQRATLLAYRRDQAQSIYGDVYATFEVSARAMMTSTKQEWIDALQLLTVLAFFHRDGIPEEMFTKAWHFSINVTEWSSSGQIGDTIQFPSLWHVGHMQKILRQLGSTKELDIVSFRKARDALQSFSLIATHPDTDDISMHPLVHAWAKDRLDDTAQTTAWASAASILSLSIENNFGYNEFFHRIRSHTEFNLGPHTESFFANDKLPALEIVRVFYRFTWILYRLGDYNLAEQLAHLLCSRIGREILPLSQHWHHVSYLLAVCQFSLDKHIEAMELLKQVVSFSEEKEPEGEYRLNALGMIGRIHVQLGEYHKGIKATEDVLRIRQEILQPTNSAISATRHDLAIAYLDNGQSEKGIKLLEEVVQIRGQSLPLTHPDRLSSQHGLALAYLENGQSEKAVNLFEEVVQIREQSLPLTHPDRLSSQHGLAIAYLDNGQSEKAIKLFEEVVQIRHKSLLPTHPNRLASQYGLARAYFKNGQYTKALPIIQDVVEVKAKIPAAGDLNRRRSEDLLSYFLAAMEEQRRDSDLGTSSSRTENNDMPGMQLDHEGDPQPSSETNISATISNLQPLSASQYPRRAIQEIVPGDPSTVEGKTVESGLKGTKRRRMK